MENIMTLKQLADCCGGQLIGCEGAQVVSDVVTDSRRVSCGSLFVALCGEKFDGHNFVTQVYGQGAVCCLVNDTF